jgi:uncharacterized protein (UPF0147 family)
MKITIDTKEDSHEEIKKVIKMLRHLVGDEKVYSNKDVFEDSSPSVSTEDSSPSAPTGNIFGNLFDDKKETTEPDTKEETEDEAPEVIEY